MPFSFDYIHNIEGHVNRFANHASEFEWKSTSFSIIRQCMYETNNFFTFFYFQ